MSPRDRPHCVPLCLSVIPEPDLSLIPPGTALAFPHCVTLTTGVQTAPT
jgi:hypothetical protein